MIYRTTPSRRLRATAKYILEGEEKTLYGAMVKAGYSPATARNPSKITQTRAWQQILDETFDDVMLSEVHMDLLKSKRLEHMTFPPYREPNDEETDPEELSSQKYLTDDAIEELIASVGGTVRRIQHGEQARHVYFWAANDKARQDALKLAYDLKGRVKPAGDPGAAGSTYNTFIQQNNINPNTPTAKQLVDASLDILMQQTKRKVTDV